MEKHTENGIKCWNLRLFQWRFLNLCLVFLFISITSIWAGNAIDSAFATTQKPLKGTVVDSKGESLIGATVLVKGTTLGTITDVEGKFSIQAPVGATLEFSYLGYSTVTYQVKTSGDIFITMTEDVHMVEEVVVVGYGVQKKETVTGAISSVNTKALVQSSQANISNALVGRLPGLTAVQKSGEPGNDQSIIRIRGIGSFAGSYDSDLQNPLVMVDGIEVANYNNIDPNEIENVAILKDASATAVYGVRGANGVILITTKRGMVEKPKLSVSTSYAINSFTNLREPMDAYNWAVQLNETRKYDGYLTGNYDPVFTDEEIRKFRDNSDPVFYPNTNWVDMLFKETSLQTQHNINLRGGTERVKYFASLGVFTQGGMYNNTDLVSDYDAQVRYKRYNFRTNFDFKVTKRLNVMLNVSDQLEFVNRPNEDTGVILSYAFSHPPTSGPGVVDGKVIENLDGRYNYSRNPVTRLMINSGALKNYSNQLNVSVKPTYDLGFLLKGLSAHAMISYQQWNWHSTRYYKEVQTYKAVKKPDGSPSYLPQGTPSPYTFTESLSQRGRTYFEAGINYSGEFGDHKVGALVLYNQTKDNNPNLLYKIPSAYTGLVGRITYSYKNRYLAEFNAGYNGTENFAKGHRFGFFPAYSLGWVLSEESFFPENRIVNFVKIRGSYGEVGNDKIGGQRFLYLPTTYTYNTSENNSNSTGSNNTYYFGTVGLDYKKWDMTASEGKLGNPDLTWERAKKMNVGVDIYFWEGRIKFTGDFFKEVRDNILANRGSVPVIVGADLPAYNLGKMKNYGFDGEISYNDRIGDFNYWVKGLFTFARNKILEMDEVDRAYPYMQRTGKPFEQYFGLIAEGFYNTWEEVNDPNRPVSIWNNNKLQPGDVKYKDVNGDGVINNNDMIPIGYAPFPEISYGFSLGGSYKNFDFSILFQGAAKSSKKASKKFYQGWQQDGSALDFLKDWSWTQEKYERGENITFPHVSADKSQAHNYQNSTLWIRDSKYLRLKNVELGYTFTNEVLKKLHIESARIYVNGTNLFTWSGLWKGEDPEVPSYNDNNYEPYPLVRTVNMGLNINF